MLYVNNEKVNRVVQGLTIKETLEDTLDHATVVYHSDSAEGFEMYSPAFLRLGNELRVDIDTSMIQLDEIYDYIDHGQPNFDVEVIYGLATADIPKRSITFESITLRWLKTQTQHEPKNYYKLGVSIGESFKWPNVIIFETNNGYRDEERPEYWYYSSTVYNVEIEFEDMFYREVVREYQVPKDIHFLVAEDNSSILGRIPNITYAHTLTLIEPTKYLERITISAQAYTNRSDLLVDQIDKALVNAEIIRVGEEPRFKISNELRAFLGVTQGEDFFFSTPTTLRDLLDEMLSVKNARVRIKELTDLENIVLDYDDLAAVGPEIEEFDNVINRSMSQNLEYLAGNLEVYAQNVEHSEEQSIWHPSAGAWDTFKTNEATLNTNNAFLDTRFPIDYITGFYASVKTKWKRSWTEGGNAYSEEGEAWVILDLTHRVLDDEAYNALPEKDGYLSKANTISYARGETAFNLKSTKRIFWSINSLESALNATFNVAKEVNKSDWIKQIFGFGHSYPESQFTFTAISETFKYDTVQVRVKYTPFIDTRFRVPKLESNVELQDLSLYDDQSDKTIELKRFISQLKDKSRQMGGKDYHIDVVLKDINSLMHLKITSGNYVLVSREYSVYDRYVKVRYRLSENFKTINERLNINREKRIYEIPLNFIERNLFINEHILLSTKPLTVSHEPYLADEWIIDRIVKGVYGRNDYFGIGDPNGPPAITRERITALLVETFKDSSLGRYQLPINIFTIDNTLVISAKFLDNYSAGYSVEGRVISGRKVLHNPYVNEKGEFDSFKIELIKEVADNRVFWMGPGGNIEKARKLPATNKDFSITGLKPFKVYKDSDEHISFTYQLSADVYSEDKENVVIGKQLLLDNHLQTSFQRQDDLVVYYSTEKYKANETTRVKGELSELSTLITSSQSGSDYHDTIYLNARYVDDGVKAWAIGDRAGNLYLAVNDINLKKVYFTVSDKIY